MASSCYIYHIFCAFKIKSVITFSFFTESGFQTVPVKGNPVLVVQDDRLISVETNPVVFLLDSVSESDVVLHTLTKLITPVSAELPFSVLDNLNKPAGQMDINQWC